MKMTVYTCMPLDLCVSQGSKGIGLSMVYPALCLFSRYRQVSTLSNYVTLLARVAHWPHDGLKVELCTVDAF